MRHKVAAVFSGHDHIYERTRPQQGVQYFVSGAGGQLRRGNIDRRSPFFAAGNDEVNSFMYVEATGDSLEFWVVDADGNILDTELSNKVERCGFQHILQVLTGEFENSFARRASRRHPADK